MPKDEKPRPQSSEDSWLRFEKKLQRLKRGDVREGMRIHARLLAAEKRLKEEKQAAADRLKSSTPPDEDWRVVMDKIRDARRLGISLDNLDTENLKPH